MLGRQRLIRAGLQLPLALRRRDCSTTSPSGGKSSQEGKQRVVKPTFIFAFRSFLIRKIYKYLESVGYTKSNKTSWEIVRDYLTWKRLINTFKELGSFSLEVLKYAGAFHLVNTYVISFTYCLGPSMLPTLREQGGFVFVDQRRPYQNGDVVICTAPNDPEKTVCKRIKASAGEMIIQHGHQVTIPKGHVWLAGDNPHNSNDSRSYGPVPLGLLCGRVFAKITWTPLFGFFGFHFYQPIIETISQQAPPPPPPPPHFPSLSS